MNYPEQSHEALLRKYLEIVKPRKIFEWGPGRSTEVMLSYGFVESVVSMEHHADYYNKAKELINDPRLKLALREDPKEYIHPIFEPIGIDDTFFDLIFIDGGIERIPCTRISRLYIRHSGVTLFHDAQLEKYQKIINEFKFKDWDKPQEQPWTVALSNETGIIT